MDQRHAEMVVKEIGLEEAKPVSTPGEEEKPWEAEENKMELEAGQATRYRRVAARLNYMAMDRVDLMYSTKEICRNIANPTVGAWKMLKRAARYLIEKARAVVRYDWQGREGEVQTYSDSDWAVMIGLHWIIGWARTQKSVTL